MNAYPRGIYRYFVVFIGTLCIHRYFVLENGNMASKTMDEITGMYLEEVTRVYEYHAPMNTALYRRTHITAARP